MTTAVTTETAGIAWIFAATLCALGAWCCAPIPLCSSSMKVGLIDVPVTLDTSMSNCLFVIDYVIAQAAMPSLVNMISKPSQHELWLSNNQTNKEHYLNNLIGKYIHKGSLTYYVVHFWVFSSPSPPQCRHDSIWKTPPPPKLVLRSMWTIPTSFYQFLFEPFLEI